MGELFNDKIEAIPLSQRVKDSIFNEYIELMGNLKRVTLTNSVNDWKKLRSNVLVLYIDIKPKLKLYPDNQRFKKLEVLDFFVSNPQRLLNCNSRGQFENNYVKDGKWISFTKADTMELVDIIREFLEVNGVMSYEEKRPTTSLDSS